MCRGCVYRASLNMCPFLHFLFWSLGVGEVLSCSACPKQGKKKIPDKSILAALCFKEIRTLSPACCPLIFVDVAWVSKSLSLPSIKPEFVLTNLPPLIPWILVHTSDFGCVFNCWGGSGVRTWAVIRCSALIMNLTITSFFPSNLQTSSPLSMLN